MKWNGFLACNAVFEGTLEKWQMEEIRKFPEELRDRIFYRDYKED